MIENLKNLKTGMIVTDTAYFGVHEVIDITKENVTFKIISGKFIGSSWNGVKTLPISIFSNSFIEVEYPMDIKFDADICDTFSFKQKVVIALILTKLTQSKGVVEFSERAFLTGITKNELKVDLEDARIPSLTNELRPLNLKDLVKNLGELSFLQKEFIVILAYKVAKFNGITKAESDYVNKITNELNILVRNIKHILTKYGYEQSTVASLQPKGYNNTGCLLLFIGIITTSFLFLISCSNIKPKDNPEVVVATAKKPFYYEIINDTVCIYGKGEMPKGFHIMKKDSFSVAIIESGITNINDGFFIQHNKLNSVFIPNTVIDIGDYVFSHSALTSVNIPENVINIGMGAFFMCHNLLSVSIPHSVINIGGGAFIECPLTVVSIPNKKCEIGRGAFCFCSRLSYVKIGDGIVKYDEKNELFNCD